MTTNLACWQSYPLILLRGLPGVGKSTLARRAFPQRFLIEADQFFVTCGGDYQWRASLATSAHAWCLKTTEAHLHVQHPVVVANTFVRRLDLSPYFRLFTQFGATPWQEKVAVVTVPHSLGMLPALARRTHASGHEVPLHVLERMHAAWEPCEGEYVLNETMPAVPQAILDVAARCAAEAGEGGG